MATETIISPDGTRIAFDVTGQGEPLMLLHGGGKTRRDWHKLGYVERLQDDFTVISVDIRGSGESDYLVELEDYEIEKISDDLYAIADACNVSQFAIWGFSFGGNIARYPAAWSDRVSAWGRRTLRRPFLGVPQGGGQEGQRACKNEQRDEKKRFRVGGRGAGSDRPDSALFRCSWRLRGRRL